MNSLEAVPFTENNIGRVATYAHGGGTQQYEGRALRRPVPYVRRLPDPMKVSIIIAVYNEANTVATLLERVWNQPLPDAAKEIIIVESNSTDGSRALVGEFLARHAPAPAAQDERLPQIKVIYQSAPRGKGHAIREGFATATGDILLIQDADLEYDVVDYPDLLIPIIEGRTAFVLGKPSYGSGWLENPEIFRTAGFNRP